MLTLCLVFVWGVIIGRLWSYLPDPDIIPRFYQMEQRQYERWQAYCALEQRLQKESPWIINGSLTTDGPSTKSTDT